MRASPAIGSCEATRIGLRVRGRVQGVGFRPFVYRLARELSLGGWVRNDGAGVEIDIEGAPERLAHFRSRLRAELPPLAHIEQLDEELRRPRSQTRAFAIVTSRDCAISTQIAPDAAVCDECLAEVLDPTNRRYRYAFTSCTHCGPRYTISRGPPYDRGRTSMAAFAQCRDCAAEYEDATDRRFHAQANGCDRCGPRLALLDARGRAIVGTDPIAGTLERIRAGEIVAVKSLGGFHLVCDAHNPVAVARLRARKQREEKPFAIMVANRASLAGLAHCSDVESELLAGAEAPIVLLRKDDGRDGSVAEVLPGIAPGVVCLGAMFPHTPLDWLLFYEAAGRPAARNWRTLRHDLVLVMTSANSRGEPLVTANEEASERLAGIADAFVVHDRPIVVRCDDSVMRIENGVPAFVRRARGYTPAPIALASDGSQVLAFGGHLKNTVCLTRGAQAFVSHHVGDLDTVAARLALEETVQHLLRVLQVHPERVACDRHPDYFSSRLARDFARQHGLEVVEVQHHHAHIAAVAAEHRLEGPLVGLALDGHGFGDDGQAWGGELLHVDGANCRRVGHLSPLVLAGGDRAAREPWRMAVAAAFALGAAQVPPGVAASAHSQAAQVLLDALNAGLACASTSSAGRLFDAAAGLLGVKPVATFEGQAAMLLEGLAECEGATAPLAQGFRIGERCELEFLPLLDALCSCRDAGRGAALFHATLAAGLCEWTAAACKRLGIARVALGGGCFLNRLLTGELRRGLAARDIETFCARAVPPNDGGLALGQAWVARRAGVDGQGIATCA
jgi:hydrogenase maturation protein HypF